MVMVVMMVLMGMLMEMAPLRQAGVVMTMTSISPSSEAPMRQDLPSPGVEDFRRRGGLNKSWEKYSLGFWEKRRRIYKGGSETMPEGQTSLGGTPKQGGRATWSLLDLVAPALRVLLWPTVLL
jgi:hypothetical protein